MRNQVERLLRSRAPLVQGLAPTWRKREAEGGCGVLGLAATLPVAGRHLLPPMRQMHNRGNGKGGGIATVGLDPHQMGVSAAVLDRDYLIQIAYLDPGSREEVERTVLAPAYHVDHHRVLSTRDPGEVPGLEVVPPQVCRYFVRPRREAVAAFADEAGLADLPGDTVEDEFVYRTSFRLNTQFYASLGEQRAFVLSHGKDMMVLKIVGYAEQVLQFYRLEDLTAHVWIGHQRYPTKGRVWHPGGAHPFVGLHEALVHNGDFANYARVTKYLRQRNIVPLFLTDTEVSALLFDLLRRVYGYPLEHVIEAMAPTTERDFLMLPPERQTLYRRLQAAHIHGSPDGPWFFILARREPNGEQQLLGITDTSMLRPQVFALQTGDPSLGLIASEKQAIDACLESLHGEDSRIAPQADRYWNARGGSYTNGGAFRFALRGPRDALQMHCTDKFGHPVEIERPALVVTARNGGSLRPPRTLDPAQAATQWQDSLKTADQEGIRSLVADLVQRGQEKETAWSRSLAILTHLLDRPYPTEGILRSRARAEIQAGIEALLDGCPAIGQSTRFEHIAWENRVDLRPPQRPNDTLVLDASAFPPEDEGSASRFVAQAVQAGWHRLLLYRLRGQRFIGCGLGAGSTATLDVYGSVGDYAASGLDGASVTIHGNAQDQVAQIMKAGRLVIHGDVGQTFLYGAKGGTIFVRGNAAGRPLINAVGKPRVVINGTALDYLAESFMAGDPHAGGGFVVVNGLRLDDQGHLVDLETPYEGGNLFSLASGGALYLRDPTEAVGRDQLNGGRFAELEDRDWALILPYLRANEAALGVSVDRLLTHEGQVRSPPAIYRKVEAVPLKALIPAHD